MQPDASHRPGKDDNAITLEVVSNDARLQALRLEWDGLVAKCDDAAFFSSYPFVMQSWIRRRTERGLRLNIVTMRQGNTLVAAVPLIRQRDWFGTSVLKWLDSGTPLYDGILIDPGIDFAIIEEQFRNYLDSVRLVRKLKVDLIPYDTPAHRLLSSFGGDRQQYATIAIASLAGFRDWQEYFSKRSSNTRQAYRRLMRRLEEQGPVSFEHITDSMELESAIGWIFERKRAWVLARYGKPNWLSARATEAYFQATAADLSSTGNAFVARLSCGDTCISAMLGYKGKNTVYLSKMAYDPNWKKFSPGWLLTIEATRLAMSLGADKLDLMTGAEEWKDRLADEFVKVHKYRLRLPLLGLKI
ncbi:GNAT family N-acetyltransferase [Mesorhizobium sp. 10J20-29]